MCATSSYRSASQSMAMRLTVYIAVSLALCSLPAICQATSNKYADDGKPDDNHFHHIRHKRAVMSLCAGQEYNTSKQRCCEGSIVNIPASLKDSSVVDITRYAWCCASSAYDIRTSLCCAGSLRSDVVSWAERRHHRCCASDVIDIRKDFCCGAAAKPLGTVPRSNAQCCAGSVFNNNITGCCAGIEFDKATQLCCEGGITSAGGVDTHMCCGATSYALAEIEAQNMLCCDGQVLENAGGLGCCGGATYDKVEMGCCANEIYEKQMDSCCDGALRPGFPEAEYECCAYGMASIAAEKMCCDRTIVRGRPELGHACCERESYKEGAQVCCGPAGKKQVLFGSDCITAASERSQHPDPKLVFLW
ncbi:galaxin-like [Sycon ciliatum]|uniref:galaxin-like n=1 Tax=Sycon ciliatum TaxID=27933 RepID=UPI0020AA4ABF|eukprot:scpid25319/ scgid30431/ 